MIRMLLLGLVVVIATLGGSYAAMQIPQGAQTSKEDPSEKTEIVKIDPISVPVVRGGKIQGYVIGRYAFSAPASEVRKDKDTLILFVSEAIFMSVYNEEDLDFAALKIVEVDKLIERILTKVNARIARPMISQIYVESLNFLAHDAVRCQQTK
ncbi:MAG: hypothetical protein J0I57_16005 [Hyphomicrobium sp.]|nr:hypothetical protein [Hyphomicrobium sp.]ODT23477.1 MAG: hypothetical protein ABS54_10440 [Hyphomicrobium sp. SCN 65-11]